MWGIFCLMYEVTRKNPSVSLRLPAPFSREPMYKKASLEKGGGPPLNVINLKRPLNGKQNVWKYQNGEEKSDSDGREKDV